MYPVKPWGIKGAVRPVYRGFYKYSIGIYIVPVWRYRRLGLLAVPGLVLWAF